jgi:hypothetical protein
MDERRVTQPIGEKLRLKDALVALPFRESLWMSSERQ